MRPLIVAAIVLAGCGTLLGDSEDVDAPPREIDGGGVEAGDNTCHFDDFSTSKFDDTCSFAP